MAALVCTLVCALNPHDLATLRHAVKLRNQGFTVIPMDADHGLLAGAASAVRRELTERLNDVEELGIHPIEQGYSFREIAHRFRNRWDLKVPASDDVNAVCNLAVDRASPIIRAVHSLPVHPDEGLKYWPRTLSPRRPKLLMTGAIISRPGADEQMFHRDSDEWHDRIASTVPSHRLYSVFIPLVDVAPNSVGTTFWPRSHLSRLGEAMYSAAEERSGTVEDDPIAQSEFVSPGCKAGDMILFDARIFHRGNANTADADRPILYAMCGTGWARDTYNFPPQRLRAALGSLPQEAEERALVKQVVAKAHFSWEEVYAQGQQRRHA